MLVPFGEGHSYDLLVEVGTGVFLRVQCKHARVRRGCMLFNSRSTDHGNGQGNYIGLAEVFGVYLPRTGSVYLVPVREVPLSTVHLRLEPPRNNQLRGIRKAQEYLIDHWTASALAALVELEERERPCAADLVVA